MPKFAVCDKRISNACAESLNDFGFEIIKLPPFSRLPAPVASHPDMLMCILGDKIVTHKEYFEQNRDIFNVIASISKKEIITSDDKVMSTYPFDISLDALVLGGSVFSLTAHTSSALLKESQKLGLKSVAVKHGYAKCSVCPVSDNAAITSDASLAGAMESCGIALLRICSGGVALEPYDYGFIGGASGYDSERVYFCGSLDSHPQCDLIVEFCKKHSKTAISLSSEPLVDVGTIFIL